MKNAGGQDGVRPTLLHAVGQMVQIAHTTGSNNRHADSVRHCTGQLQIKAVFPEGEVEIEQFNNVAGNLAESESEDSRQAAA